MTRTKTCKIFKNQNFYNYGLHDITIQPDGTIKLESGGQYSETPSEMVTMCLDRFLEYIARSAKTRGLLAAAFLNSVVRDYRDKIKLRPGYDYESEQSDIECHKSPRMEYSSEKQMIDAAHWLENKKNRINTELGTPSITDLIFYATIDLS